MIIARASQANMAAPGTRPRPMRVMIPCLRNECEEVVQAIEQHDPENLCEELGDVLAPGTSSCTELPRKKDSSRWHDVVNGLAEKMVRRHPHVFGE